MATSFSKPADEVYRRALASLNDGTAPRLIAPLRQAVRAAPKDPRLWQVLGLACREADDRESAIAALRKAAALAPMEQGIAHGLARSLFEAGLPSVDAYGAALRLSPGDPAIIEGLTAALVSEGQSEVAAAGLEKILERSPLWTVGHDMLSSLRWMAGERQHFARSFARALERHTDSLGLWQAYIVALFHAHDYDAVLDAIAVGREAIGDQLLFDANEAIAHAEKGDVATADRLFAPLTEIQDSTVQIRRVRHLLRARRPDQASALIDQWIEGEDRAAFLPYAATAWRLTGDPRLAWLEGDNRLVGIYDIADRLPPLDKLAATLRRLHVMHGQPLEQSVRGGTQTEGNLFHRIDPILASVRETVRSIVAEHAAQLPPHDPTHPTLSPPRGSIGFSGAWSVRLQAGGHHTNHVHPLGWYSSALYVALPPDLGPEHAGWLTLGEPPADLGLDLPPSRLVEPKPGRLVLFPSTMWHGTRPFGAGERMTVAFDVAMPR